MAQHKSRRRNAAAHPFHPSEVEDVRRDVERAVGDVADRHGLSLKYDEVAATETTIPVRFKMTRRKAEQRDMFTNPRRSTRKRNTHQPQVSARMAAGRLDRAAEELVSASDDFQRGAFESGAQHLLLAVFHLGQAETESRYADEGVARSVSERIDELVGHLRSGSWAQTVVTAAGEIPIAANPRPRTRRRVTAGPKTSKRRSVTGERRSKSRARRA